VFISSYNGGEDEWFSIEAGANGTWHRTATHDHIWELVAVKLEKNENLRKGVYLRFHQDTTVTIGRANNDNSNNNETAFTQSDQVHITHS